MHSHNGFSGFSYMSGLVLKILSVLNQKHLISLIGRHVH